MVVSPVFVPDYLKIFTLKFRVILVPGSLEMSATYWPSPSTSTRIKSHAAAAADLQHPCKEFSVESRNEALCALEKAGRTGRERVRYFQEMFS